MQRALAWGKRCQLPGACDVFEQLADESPSPADRRHDIATVYAKEVVRWHRKRGSSSRQNGRSKGGSRSSGHASMSAAGVAAHLRLLLRRRIHRPLNQRSLAEYRSIDMPLQPRRSKDHGTRRCLAANCGPARATCEGRSKDEPRVSPASTSRCMRTAQTRVTPRPRNNRAAVDPAIQWNANQAEGLSSSQLWLRGLRNGLKVHGRDNRLIKKRH